jgi:hypothetical protein
LLRAVNAIQSLLDSNRLTEAIGDKELQKFVFGGNCFGVTEKIIKDIWKFKINTIPLYY